MGNIRLPVPPPAPDLAPLQRRLDELQVTVKAVAAQAAPPPLNLAPTHERLVALGVAIEGIRIPAPVRVDLSALMQRLDASDARLLRAAAPALAPASPPAPSAVRSGSRNLLHSAACGQPDDLKHIKGVAEVLERLLHGIGVYCCWQIAEWLPADVAHADAQLTAFHRRIERDDWVTQSAAFARADNAARKPASP